MQGEYGMRSIKKDKRPIKALVFRMPDEVFSALQDHAEREYRSLNAQLLCIVEAWFQEQRDRHEREPSVPVA